MGLWHYAQPAPPTRANLQEAGGSASRTFVFILMPDNHGSIMCLTTHIMIYFIDIIMNA